MGCRGLPRPRAYAFFTRAAPFPTPPFSSENSKRTPANLAYALALLKRRICRSITTSTYSSAGSSRSPPSRSSTWRGAFPRARTLKQDSKAPARGILNRSRQIYSLTPSNYNSWLRQIHLAQENVRVPFPPVKAPPLLNMVLH